MAISYIIYEHKVEHCRHNAFAILYHYISVIPPFPRLYMLIQAIKDNMVKTFNNANVYPSDQLCYFNKNLILSTRGTIFVIKTFFGLLLPAYSSVLFVPQKTSEFTQRFISESTLTFHDVAIANDHAEIIIKSSKTYPFRNGCIIRLAPTSNSLGPIIALKQLLTHHRKQKWTILYILRWHIYNYP